MPSSVSPDGKWLLYTQNDENGAPRALVAPLNPDGMAGEPRPLRSGPAADLDARVSPDGKWVAFGSNQSGTREAYVMPFHGPGGVTPVAAGPSREPRWSRDGRELFFWDSTARTALWSVRVSTSPSLSLGEPIKVLSLKSAGTTWDVAPDGRFLVELPPMSGDWPTSTLAIVTNWFVESDRLAPPGTGK